MEWKRLQKMRCPKCNANIEDVTIGYRCVKNTTTVQSLCDFFVGYQKFNKLIDDMTSPKKVLYDPDKVDRSGWEW